MAALWAMHSQKDSLDQMSWALSCDFLIRFHPSAGSTVDLESNTWKAQPGKIPPHLVGATQRWLEVDVTSEPYLLVSAYQFAKCKEFLPRRKPCFQRLLLAKPAGGSDPGEAAVHKLPLHVKNRMHRRFRWTSRGWARVATSERSRGGTPS
jgi:hypothetical protein